MIAIEKLNGDAMAQFPQFLRALEEQHRQLTEELGGLLRQVRLFREDMGAVSGIELHELAWKVRAFEQQTGEHFLAEEKSIMPALLDYDRTTDMFAPTVHFSKLVMDDHYRNARARLLDFIEQADALSGQVPPYRIAKLLNLLLDGLMIMTASLIVEHRYVLPPACRMADLYGKEASH